MTAVEITDLADKHRADLDLGDLAEVFGVHYSKLTAVFGKYRNILKCHRLYRMKFSGNEMIDTLYAIVNVGISMIVIDAQPEYKAVTAFISCGKLS